MESAMLGLKLRDHITNRGVGWSGTGSEKAKMEHMRKALSSSESRGLINDDDDDVEVLSS